MSNWTARLEAGAWDAMFGRATKAMQRRSDLLVAAFNTAGFKDIVEHFRDQEGPDGEWEPRKAETNKRYDQIRRGGARRRRMIRKFGSAEKARESGMRVLKPNVGGVPRGAYSSNNKLLQLTGRLRGSLVRQNLKKLGNDSIMFFSTDPKSGRHDRGDSAKGLPKREFMWLSDDAKETMTKIILGHLMGGK